MAELIQGNLKIRKRLAAIIPLLTILVSANGYATGTGAIEYTGSGFMTLATGKILGGTHANVMDYNCPCFISDYAQAGVYQNSGLQWGPDSKIGAQGTASLDNQKYSLTTQVVARDANNGGVDLEWLYGSYKLSNKITLQAGRKRLPILYYSEVQDVGVALPWTHLPPGPYGWEAVNYNGINIGYADQWKKWSATLNLIAGSENKKDTGYYKVSGYGRQSKSDIKWSNIVGGDLALAKDGIETRFMYLQSFNEQTNVSGVWNGVNYDPAIGPINPPAKQQIYGFTLNTDYQNWLLRTEFIRIKHPGLGWGDFAQLVGVGYRYQKWQPMATWSRYKGTSISDGLLPGVTPFPENMQQTISMTLRYELTTSSAIKVQYDNQTDHSDPAYNAYNYNFGNSRLLSLSYDVVF